MKKTILPALAMLIISAVMLSTASYAWFAMSDTATATDMKVNIKTDSSFLMISDAKTVDPDGTKSAEQILAAVQAAATTTVPFASVASTELYPAAHKTFSGEKTAAQAYYAAVGNWYTKTADKATASASSGAEKPLSNFNTYVLVNSFYIAVAQGTTDMINLQASVDVKGVTSGAEGDDAIKVVVVSSNDWHEYDYNNEAAPDGMNLGTVTSSAVVKVDVYIYFDGNVETVFTNNIKSILPTAIDVTFTAEPKPAAQQ